MRYADFIKGNEGFQYSINIQYDLMNPNKINGYIPTRISVEILKEYLLNTLIDDRDKATVLIGPYGKGKSHLLLILLGLMCGNKDSKELNELVEKISKIDYDCGQVANDVLSKKKYLPLVINFNSGYLTQAFLIALNQALKNNNIQDILPNTYFDSAITVLEGWEGYEGTIATVKNLIKEKCKVDLATFKRKLKSFDIEAYETFKSIFKEVTSGVEFNPFINTDVVKLFEETNHALKEKYNYDGMIVVFDEFSKFIEASAEMNSAMNLKILQDLAELSSRSKSPQIHLVCITHKTINEYISKIPQEKIDAWRAIEGRFKEILFNSSSQQNYELISNAIIKDLTKVRCELEKEQFKNNISISSAFDLFKYNEEDYRNYIVEGCFPLNPFSTYALPIISEKVAQNERTLFTYLSKDEPNSLIDLVNDNEEEFDFVTIDRLYDYFEPLFKKETFNEAIHDIWLKTDTALKIVYSEEEKKVIKALGIIYILNDSISLPPTEKMLSNILSIDKVKLEEIVANLRNTNVLVLRRSSETLDFIPISSVDINGKIKNLAETKFKMPNFTECLSDLANLKYVLPKKYNDDYKMTRFFKRTFMTIDQLTAYKNTEKLLEDYKADGIIVDLICVNEEDAVEAVKWKDEVKDNRIVLVIPKETLKIKEDIAEYKAISCLKSDEEFLKEDAAIESQLDIMFEDVVEKITEYVNKIYDISNSKSTLYINNEEYSGIKPTKLSKLLSIICEENFSNAVVINNEMINKQEISAQIRKARNNIIDMLLDDGYLDFDSSKTAVECTLFRTTLLNKGLLKSDNEYDSDITRLLDEIKSFILRASDKELSFEELYSLVTTNRKKIGIRKGVLPIYLAFVLKDFKDEAIIYLKSGRSKKELVLDTSIIDNINSNPKDYLIKIEEGTVEKDRYITELTKMFNVYLKKSSKNKYVDIIHGMKSWIQSLSLFTQNHKYNIETKENVKNEVVKLRSELVKYELNYRSFIFETLPKYLKAESFDSCIETLRDIKIYLDKHDEKVREYLINESKLIIDKEYKGTLSGSLKKWYSELTEEQKAHLYNSETNELLRYIQNVDNNEIDVINKLAYIFTNLSIEDWNDNTINIYLESIKDSKKQVESYEVVADSDTDAEITKIVINGEEKTFTKADISPLGSTLFNAIEEALDEYGDSIDDNEKRNILMDILSKYI